MNLRKNLRIHAFRRKIRAALKDQGIYNKALIEGYIATELALDSVGMGHMFDCFEEEDSAHIYEDFRMWARILGYTPTEELMD